MDLVDVQRSKMDLSPLPPVQFPCFKPSGLTLLSCKAKLLDVTWYDTYSLKKIKALGIAPVELYGQLYW